MLVCRRSTTWTPTDSSGKRVSISESSQHLRWLVRCALTRGCRICTGITNRRLPTQHPARLLACYRPRNHAGHLATRRMLTSLQHASRCPQFLKPWALNSRCPTPDLSHLRPLFQHKHHNITFPSLQTPRPRILANDHSSLIRTALKDRPIRSRTPAVPSSAHLHPRYHHLHPRASWIRHPDRPTRHVPSIRKHSTAQDCRHCMLLRLRSPLLRPLPDQTCHILRTHPPLRQPMNLLHLNQPNQ